MRCAFQKTLHKSGWTWLAMLCLLGWWAQAQAQAQAQVVEGDSDAHTLGVSRTVQGILGYTRWPGDMAVVRLCVIGPTEFADALLHEKNMSLGLQALQVRRVRLEDITGPGECDGIYAGQLSVQAWRELMQRLAGQPLLTISERGELCRVGAMFCLRGRGEGLGFEVNLDSVARSGVRVNPKVLQLARQKTAP